MNLQEMVASYIFNDKMQKKIVDALNDNIDIPFISEKTEEKYISAIYETVEAVVKGVILKK